MCYTLFGLCLLANRRGRTKPTATTNIPLSGSGPTVFELLQCWLLYGPSLEIYSPSNQTFQQMLSCWESNSYRACPTDMSAAILKQCTEIYGKYYKVQGKGKSKSFPYIQLDEFRKCWVQYGSGSGNQTFIVMMDVWVDNEDAIRLKGEQAEIVPQMEDDEVPEVET